MMTRRFKTRRRTEKFRVAPRTVAVVLGTVAIAALSIRSAAGFVLADRDPGLAVQLAPASGVANSAYASFLLLSPNGSSTLDKAEQAARKALMNEPLSSVAARNLGFVAIAKQQETLAHDWMLLGNALSRRDMLLQAWLYTQGISQGRPTEATDAADLILRQSSDSWDTMMPALADNLRDGAYIQPLTDALARRPVWRAPFLAKAGANTQISANFWQLLAKLKRAGAPPTTAEVAPYFTSQADTANPQILWNQWMSMVPGSTATSLIRDGKMDRIDAPPPFVWRLNPAEGVIAEISKAPDGKGSALYLSFEDRPLVNFGQQKLVLKPGRYRLEAKGLLERADEGSTVFAAIKCGSISASGEEARLSFAMTGDEWTVIRTEFTIPATCPAQYVWIGGESQLGVGGASLWIDDVSITTLAR